MKTKILPFLIILLYGKVAVAQCNNIGAGLNIAVATTPATCPLNGSITINVTASAAGAPYTFTLTSTCLNMPLVQSQSTPNYTFNALQGNCTYTICVSDAGGNIISNTATVANNYSPLINMVISDAMFTNASCSKITATVTGGRPPFVYELFSGSVAVGPPIQGPQATNEFFNINPTAVYSVRITDACMQSIVATRLTGPLKLATIAVIRPELESCTSIRQLLLFNDAYGGSLFQDNSIQNATNAGLKFPITVTATNNAGVLLPNYPYILQANTSAGWGQSANTALGDDIRWSPKLPNAAAQFPINFSYTDACGATASAVIPYNPEFARAVYVKDFSFDVDTVVCPVKSCIKVSLGGDFIAGNNYNIALYTNATATGTPLQTISYPNLNKFCALNFNTTYYLKTFDPCLNKDTIITIQTPAAPAPFTVSIGDCSTYCDNNANNIYSYTGLYPISVVATSGPVSSGPYPKPVSFSTNGVAITTNTGVITGLAPGNYSLLFTAKCGETANANVTVNEGSITSLPQTTVTITSCGSAAVKIVPNISTSGQMLAYHNSPGCHSPAGVAYYANIIIGQIIGGAPIPGSNTFNADNPNSSYTFTVNTAGTYVATIAYSQGLPGINNAVSSCYQIIRDTFTVAFNTIPNIERVYTLPCTNGSYTIVPVAPTAIVGTTYTLFAANGTTVIAGPQTSNTFLNVNVAAGTNLVIKATDPCGQTSIVPFSTTTSTTISGAVTCVIQPNNNSANKLTADFINGATYVWTAPNDNTFNGFNPPLVTPAQAGTWLLTTTIQSGACTATLSNSFVVSACFVIPPPTPLPDTIVLAVNAVACKATLQFQINAEQNAIRYEVEQSTDNVNWTLVATVLPTANNSQPQQYSVPTNVPVGTVYYRIKYIKTNGIVYSNVVVVISTCTPITNNDVLIKVDDPNGIGLQFNSSSRRGDAVIIFVDAIGRRYASAPIKINFGYNYYQFTPPQYLAKGAYFIRLATINPKWFSNTIKIVLIK